MSERSISSGRGLGSLFMCTAVALMAPAAAPGQAAEGADTRPPPGLAEVHDLLNRHRASVGCTALLWHEPTAGVARAHSRDMLERDYFDHVSPDGMDPGERLLAAGVTWHGSVAENIARTPAGAVSAGELWLDSAHHRDNVERCEFTHHGIGGYGDRWSQVLVQRPGPAP